MRSSDLPQRISRRLLQDIASGGLQTGQHLGAQQLADRYGVSRTPIREALNLLEQRGFLQRQENRGFFVGELDPDVVAEVLEQQPEQDQSPYHRLADDWLRGELPEEVTEQFLRQRYDWSKACTSEVLVRATREGWVERKEGYGWRFLPVANTPEAFDEIYRFRMAIEPAAMLEPSFELNRGVLTELRRTQEGMLEMDFSSVPAETLLQNGSVFHEEVIKFSGNPFFLVSLQRVNRMRRLMEYRADVNHDRLIEQCTEHIEILDLLEAGDNLGASHRMRRHLSSALKRKSPLAWSWAADAN
ncbi:GntR family transcriptional regulator [Ruegeria sp. HKCCA5014]|uniref:GntR family transcriptional regulator n=1 Tax=Ruegeria sp. HKCCA5014 TaxID=2682980 RepID=UPI00148964E4|nr:GntR family transcriptional regulator [Ruegeria sp. HKCCA5014]